MEKSRIFIVLIVWVALVVIISLTFIVIKKLSHQEDLNNYTKKGKGDLMLEYKVASNMLYEPEGYTYKIKIYDNRKAEYIKPNYKTETTTIDEKTYVEIIKRTFSNNFIKLGDITDNTALDGDYGYIYVYKDGEKYTIGGCNPSNELYGEAVFKIRNIFQ